MTSVIFYAGPDDNEALRNKIESLGLRLYKAICSETGLPVEQEAGIYYGFISFQSPQELHPYGGPGHGGRFLISEVNDPLIGWHKSYTTEYEGDRYIIHGSLTWDFADASRSDELALGKRYFGQLSRWVRKNWPPVRKRGTCRGPQAQKMIQFESFIATGLPPGLKTTYVEVPGRSRKAANNEHPPDRKGLPTKQDPADKKVSPSQQSGRLAALWKFVVFPILAVGLCLAIMIYADSL